ncbi:SGNH/GDSL hydrolase family protein [Actinomadura rudentiformis]|uniref:SGNH/GDSL hydrolase family protein n=1 Tax=Actinomadura rudentiformis TaxID=359158 RepID=A0A6H9YY49_9ACTN|nr:SGNH/GDSL hydrolase family protein [Actinomadura rudentiformis]KAB2346137.1 SGNH/GDSL hydrolase family protein [Actinomadura rudentiformis]
MSYLRYVAIGDSQSEGLMDGDELTGYRGWADRLAELLAATEPAVTYANLAVRGKLAAQVRAEQLAPALALKPDLASVMAGMNDLVRPGFDAAAVTGELEAMFAALTGQGAQVVTFTFPDIAKIAPVVARLRPRVLELNAGIRDAARRHGVIVVDAFPHAVTCDARLWSPDRIHAAPLGHALMAAAAAHALGLPDSDDSWTNPLPAARPIGTLRRVGNEAFWVGSFLGPWVMRRLRGRSSGDGRVAKRPDLLPVRDTQPAP